MILVFWRWLLGLASVGILVTGIQIGARIPIARRTWLKHGRKRNLGNLSGFAYSHEQSGVTRMTNENTEHDHGEFCLGCETIALAREGFDQRAPDVLGPLQEMIEGIAFAAGAYSSEEFKVFPRTKRTIILSIINSAAEAGLNRLEETIDEQINSRNTNQH